MVVLCVGCGPAPAPDGGTGGGSGGGSSSTGNFVDNPSFETGDLDGWFARDGAMAAVGDAHSGTKAVRMTVPSSGTPIATIAMSRPAVTMLGTGTYCGTLWAKNTCNVRMILRAIKTNSELDTTFNDTATSAWTRVPPNITMKIAGDNADQLYVLVQTRGAKAGDTLDIDDVDVWLSPSGRCDEVR